MASSPNSSRHSVLIWLTATPTPKFQQWMAPLSLTLLITRVLLGHFSTSLSLRPDIAYVVQQVCLHMHDPHELRLSAMKRILR